MNAKQAETQTETTTPGAKAKTETRRGTRGATKAKAARTAPKAARPPKAATGDTKGKSREGTKQGVLVEMLKRPDGATIQEMMKATGWLSHTVRGAMAGALKKRLGLKIASEKIDGRGRAYRKGD
jgi:hypothetical protein